MRRNKELRKIIKKAEAAGWRVDTTRAGYRFLHPNGVDTVGVHRSTSDTARAHKSTKTDFRRLGLEV